MLRLILLLFLFLIPALAFSQGVDEAQLAKAKAVQARHEVELLSKPGVAGVGVGLSETGDGVAIHIYVNEKVGRPVLPRNIEGVPVRIIKTEGFVAQ
jgi:hypothetical protein